MEGKRASVAALCCMLILLSGQLHQVAAMSKFCRCYKQCYPECRKSLPPLICKLKCVDDCSPNKKVVATTTPAGDCAEICSISICGTAVDGPTDVEACVHDCTKNWSLYAKHLQDRGNVDVSHKQNSV